MTTTQRTDQPGRRQSVYRSALAQQLVGATMLIIGFALVWAVIAGI